MSLSGCARPGLRTCQNPKQKRDRIRYHGGEFIDLIVGGSTYDLAAAAALEDVERTGATLVPPFDDLRTIAGQGTIAVEVLGQLEDEPDLVVVPVGGGGCIAGSPPTWPSGRPTPRCWASSRLVRPP